MFLWSISALLCLHVLSIHAQSNSAASVCQRPWQTRMVYAQTAVSSEVLRTHLLAGKPVKVLLIHRNYRETFTMDNINMNGDVICGETIERMSSPISPTAEFEPILVCTNGYVSYLNASASKWDNNVQSHEWKVDRISFATRDYSPEDKPVMSHYLDGSIIYEYVDNFNLDTFAKKAELRGVMRDRGYSFTMENTHKDFKTGHISGQSLSHISQSYTNTGGITFRDQPYHWLSSWETTGRRDSARWTVGGMDALKHTNDFVALQWYADACWDTVYSHDENGTRLGGSLDMLRMYIQMGHRVRVHFDGYTLEAASVVVSPDGDIMAQTSAEMARRRGDGADKTFFNSKTRQVYRLVHTSGLVRSFLYFIENGQLSAKSTVKFPILWSVDTRPWNPIFTTNSSNEATFGSVQDMTSVLDDASMRVKLEIEEKDKMYAGKNTEIYIELNNIRIPDFSLPKPEIIGQSLRTVPFYRNAEDSSFHMFLYNPVKQFLEVSTASGLTVTSFDMATREYKDLPGMDPISITWYQDSSLSV